VCSPLCFLIPVICLLLLPLPFCGSQSNIFSEELYTARAEAVFAPLDGLDPEHLERSMRFAQ